MIALFKIVTVLLADALRFGILLLRPSRSLAAENLVLRRQLALYQERGVKPCRVDAAARASLAFLSRLCDWRSCLIVVRPAMLIRWHRAGWHLFWRYNETGSPSHSTGNSPADSAHGHRESPLGRGAYRQ